MRRKQGNVFPDEGSWNGQAARELECDNDPERFKDRLKKLVQLEPVPERSE